MNEATMTLPWNMHPDLTHDRLARVTQLIIKGRADAVEWQNPAIGDNDWILGCRAFNACCHQIQQEANAGTALWLTLIDESKHFVFRIGEVPMRFYRGDPEDPNHRTRRQSFPELAQLSIAFPNDDVEQLIYRLAVETDLDGQAVSVSVVAFLGDTVQVNWKIPLDTIAPLITPMVPPAEGVELEPPAIGDTKPNKKGSAESA